MFKRIFRGANVLLQFLHEGQKGEDRLEKPRKQRGEKMKGKNWRGSNWKRESNFEAFKLYGAHLPVIKMPRTREFRIVE